MTHSEPTLSQGSPFWQFSLAFYRRPLVAEACVTLQDRNGVDVNVLLFLLWLATEKRRLGPGEVREIDDRVAAWRRDAVVPLRAVRRTLKGHASLGDRESVEKLRTRIKAIELEAERLQQEALYALAIGMRPGRANDATQDAARANLVAYESVLGAPFPDDLVARLVAALAEKGPAA